MLGRYEIRKVRVTYKGTVGVRLHRDHAMLLSKAEMVVAFLDSGNSIPAAIIVFGKDVYVNYVGGMVRQVGLVVMRIEEFTEPVDGDM